VSETDELSALAEASRYLFGNMLLVGDADLTARTPCQDWDLRKLLGHIHLSLHEVTAVLAVAEFDVESGPSDRLGGRIDQLAALRTAIVDLLLASTSLPVAGRWCEIWGRALPARIVVCVAAIEMVLHAWDIAQACGAHRPIPTDLASALLAVAPPLARAGVTGHVVAEPLPVAATATPGDRLLALFGRPPVLQER
jgi:uncharacterized protein (TIGR03086 family)